VVVVVVRSRRRRLPASAPRSPSALAWPWQAATPSPLQRPRTLFRHARARPPAATHATISSRHARRHCRERDTACAEVPPCSAASSASSDAQPRVVGRCRISQPPRASPSHAPGRSLAGNHAQPSHHPQALCTLRGRAGRWRSGRGTGIRLTRCAALAPKTTPERDLSTLAGGRIRTPLGGRLPCGPEGLRTGRPQLSKTDGANAAK